jgi:hypothetical protein
VPSRGRRGMGRSPDPRQKRYRLQAQAGDRDSKPATPAWEADVFEPVMGGRTVTGPSPGAGAAVGERIGVTTLGLITSVIAAWTIIASLVFAPSTARWVIFASACAHVILSMASLVIREITTERVVHHLDVAERESLAAH